MLSLHPGILLGLWIIDSGASSHMLGTRNLFTRLSQLSDIRSVAIVDSQSYPVLGEGVVQASSQLSLENVLFVPDFLLISYQLVLLQNSYIVMSPSFLSIALFRIYRRRGGLV